MIEFIKEIVKLFLPPIFFKYRRVFNGIYDDFNDIPNLTSYDSTESLDNIYNETVKKLRSCKSRKMLPDAHPRSQISNLLPLIISLQKNKREVCVLDYGGGMGTSYIDCIRSIDVSNIKYYVYDLKESIGLGKKIFPQGSNIKFVNNIKSIENVDIIYLGSLLQYIADYKKLLNELINKSPKYIFITDNFMGNIRYATAQTNMKGRRLGNWIFELKEVIQVFRDNDFNLIYKSVNYQPFINFNNFPEQYRVIDSCNLLFSRETG
jgi:putative methyltransferase (TIGR04325 family)